MNNVSKYQEIKSKKVYQILKEFSSHIDNDGNFPPINWDIIFNSLKQKKIYKESEKPHFKRCVTSLANPYPLLKHYNGSDYSITDIGNLVCLAWKEEYEKEETITDSLDMENTKKIQNELENKIKEHDESYYLFSVFISHSTEDYGDLHGLLLEMISNKIKPEIWFEEVDEEVRDKLCNKIDKSDLFLIYLTEKTIQSQMTNNEIGFVEGKRYYNRIEGKEQNNVIRIFHNEFDINKLAGFYTKAKDLIPFLPNNSDDIKKIINVINQRVNEVKPITIPSSREKFEEYLRQQYPDGSPWLIDAAYQDFFYNIYKEYEEGPDRDILWTIEEKPRALFIRYLGIFSHDVLNNPIGNPQVLDGMKPWIEKRIAKAKVKYNIPSK